MSFRNLPILAVAGVMLAGLCSTPAFAAGAEYAPSERQGRELSSAAHERSSGRDAWLAECRQRSAPVEVEDDEGWGRHHRHPAAANDTVDRCAAYLADYESWATTVRAGYEAQQSTARVNPCCRPICSQAVEYIETYVPARRHIRRPDKRIRVAPDKRVRLQ